MNHNECIHCPMKFNPDTAGKTDERGGTLTGWYLPAGVDRTSVSPHEHEAPRCAALCGEDVDPEDGMFCSDDCRRDYIRENGD